MTSPRQLETLLDRQLRLRGLARVPGTLAFAHRGDPVRVAIGESVYRGLIVTVHEGPNRARQFRAVDGTYDWDAIAACVVDAAEQRRLERRGVRRSPPRAGPRPPAAAPFTIAPSAAPGRMRVNVADMDLDPAAAMQLYALLRQAGAVA